ncbi:hypothetical protein PK35_14720 [Tamlana nanhaiensis]|uniref:Carboxypeptidase-like regulatory domain-containing protein n=2 Tax=Neotamlana nanhaiensis TaxID=1382798 RepID=A0A0D7W0K8_9FLAO|nr:hypothetical protein PK35_14720 [Tamlana nanhaiensis]
MSIFSQNITARIIDKNTKAPIPYATIKTGKNSGLISNDDGYFTLNNLNNDAITITISCLGYESETLSISAIKKANLLIKLSQALNQLDEVYISNKRPNADSIIAKVRQNISKNYNANLNKHSIFHRTTNYGHFDHLDFEIDKASEFNKQNLARANAELIALSKKVRESDAKHFTDFKGELYTLNQDSSKLAVSKATKLLDAKNNFSIEEVQDRAQKIVLTYLDTTKTYKVKTGFFTVEDSLALNDEEFKNKNKDKFELSTLNNDAKRLLKRTQFAENSLLTQFINPNLYDYEFEDVTLYNSNLTYIINFSPRKGKAKHSGTMYVNDGDYAITKVEYSYYKNRHGEKLNLKLLLGVKYIENANRGSILFEKGSTFYHPKYIKHTSGSYFYFSRDFKLIENSRDRNKIKFSIKLEGENRSKVEMLFTENSQITQSDFDAITQEETAPFKVLSAFDKTTWANEATLEPTEEMKAFSGED